MQNHIKIILRGFGQVMLQNNALTGSLFLIGIFYNSWIMGVGAIIGNVFGNITAIFLKYSKQDIKNGLYGFNGTLVGIAVWFFFEVNVYTFLAIIAGAMLSAAIMHEMNKRIPAFTAPFVVSTWIVIFGIKMFNSAFLLATTLLPQNISFNLFSTISMGMGQVMFQGSIITGIIFFLAILVNSRTAVFYAFYGSLIGGLFAMLLHQPVTMVNMGLFGYNAVLCSIVLGNKKLSGFMLATLATLLSVLANYILGKFEIISLTAPFVVATWAVLLIKNFSAKPKTAS